MHYKKAEKKNDFWIIVIKMADFDVTVLNITEKEIPNVYHKFIGIYYSISIYNFYEIVNPEWTSFYLKHFYVELNPSISCFLSGLTWQTFVTSLHAIRLSNPSLIWEHFNSCPCED